MSQNQHSLALFQNEAASQSIPQLEEIEQKLSERRAELDAVNADIQARKAAIERELQSLYTEANDVIRRLKKLRAIEEQLRTDLADKELALAKREAALKPASARLLKL